jgi:hypothetical protein
MAQPLSPGEAAHNRITNFKQLTSSVLLIVAITSFLGAYV